MKNRNDTLKMLIYLYRNPRGWASESELKKFSVDKSALRSDGLIGLRDIPDSGTFYFLKPSGYAFVHSILNERWQNVLSVIALAVSIAAAVISIFF